MIDRLAGFLRELRRRKVYGVAAASAAVAWGIIEVASVVLPTFGAPEWTMQAVVIAAVAGFALAVALAWMYKLGPEGIEKDVSIPRPLFTPDLPLDSSQLSIAVLPFVEHGAAQDGRHLCDGFTELLITRLAGIRSLSVISRTTAMQYQGTDKAIPQIAGELNVTHLVEGSVIRDDHQMQVMVQLVDGRIDRHVWAETYARPMSDLLNLMNEIALAVAEEVRVKLTPDEAGRLEQTHTVDPRALDQFLRGRHHLSRRTADSFAAALDAFQAAIDIEPRFASAYAGMADIYLMSALYGHRSPQEGFQLARSYSDKAVELDPHSAEGHTNRGSIKMFYDWDFHGAEQQMLKALNLNPSLPTAHLAYGDLLFIFDRGEEALAHIEEAVRLDPLDLGMNMNRGDFLYFLGRFEDSAAQHRKLLEMNPAFFPSQARLAKALACLGDTEGARSALGELQAAAPPALWLETAAVTYGKLGDRARAESAMQDWLALEGTHRSPLPVAWAYAAMGDRDAAIEWLEKSLQARSPTLVLSHVQPMFEPLRGDARFQAILEQIGIPAKQGSKPRGQGKGTE